jgi:uncharacterized protein with PIN domain
VSLYLDTSCLLKMVFPEPESARVFALCAAEQRVVVSSLSRLEAAVQINARLVGGTLTRTSAARIRSKLNATLALAQIIGAFRVTLLDKEPVMPVGIVTTQPDRSPMFAISPR